MSACMNAKDKLIGTHNGRFHADDVTACALLRQLPEYSSARIIRTRDPKELAQCDIVLDVGGIFDASTHRYDHHQRDFNLTFRDFFPDSKWDIRLSSAGLIYVHFGHRILRTVTNCLSDDPLIDALFRKIYSDFIAEIDAIDNGVDMFDGPRRYKINTDLSTRVALINPPWNQTDVDDMVCFHKALAVVESELLTIIKHYAEVWYPALPKVLQAVNDRFNTDPSGAIIFFDDNYPLTPYMEELDEFCKNCANKDNGDKTKQACLPVFSLSQRYDKTWSITALSEVGYRFKQRLSLPEHWRGLRDQELSDKVGIPGCIFVHASGFLGVHSTREGAIEMAKLAMKSANINS